MHFNDFCQRENKMNSLLDCHEFFPPQNFQNPEPTSMSHKYQIYLCCRYVHLKEKNFGCSHCDYRTLFKSDLTKHENAVHHGIRRVKKKKDYTPTIALPLAIPAKPKHVARGAGGGRKE